MRSAEQPFRIAKKILVIGLVQERYINNITGFRQRNKFAVVIEKQDLVIILSIGIIRDDIRKHKIFSFMGSIPMLFDCYLSEVFDFIRVPGYFADADSRKVPVNQPFRQQRKDTVGMVGPDF